LINEHPRLATSLPRCQPHLRGIGRHVLHAHDANAPDTLTDIDDDEPEQVVAHIVTCVKPLVPKVSTDEWEVSAGAVFGWVYLHRREATIAAWHLERRELESSAEGIQSPPLTNPTSFR